MPSFSEFMRNSRLIFFRKTAPHTSVFIAYDAKSPGRRQSGTHFYAVSPLSAPLPPVLPPGCLLIPNVSVPLFLPPPFCLFLARQPFCSPLQRCHSVFFLHRRIFASLASPLFCCFLATPLLRFLSRGTF